MTNETLETIKSRRSCRAYKPEQITDEELNAVLEAGTYAASAMGRQSAKIVVVQDAATRAQLTRMNAAVMGKDTDPMYGAPTILVVLADAHAANAVPDGSLVMGNLMLAAASLGLGSCWINRAKEEFETEEGKALLKKWGIEGDYIGVGHCILDPGEGVGLIGLEVPGHIGIDPGMPEDYCLAGTAHGKVGQAVVLGNNLQPLEEVCAGHCVSLKVIRLPSGKGLELTVLGLDFLDDFLQNHKVTAFFGGLSVGAAGFELSFRRTEAGDASGVSQRPAHTNVGVLP